MDIDEVKHVARLARLAIDEQQAEHYRQDLNDILTLVETMQARETEGVAPMSNPLDATQRLRPDAVTEAVDRELFQENAPHAEEGLFLVPKVID
ncbi:MAG: Asp-tRNA(Asn)/Glu-tRNA(Gln) amidotransferase subunit GatC [Pseudomonadota bacterium]